MSNTWPTTNFFFGLRLPMLLDLQNFTCSRYSIIIPNEFNSIKNKNKTRLFLIWLSFTWLKSMKNRPN